MIPNHSQIPFIGAVGYWKKFKAIEKASAGLSFQRSRTAGESGGKGKEKGEDFAVGDLADVPTEQHVQNSLGNTFGSEADEWSNLPLWRALSSAGSPSRSGGGAAIASTGYMPFSA